MKNYADVTNVKPGLNSRDHSAAYKQMLINLILGQVIVFIPFMGKVNLLKMQCILHRWCQNYKWYLFVLMPLSHADSLLKFVFPFQLIHQKKFAF